MSNAEILELKNKIFAAVMEFEYQLSKSSDKTLELTNTISALMVKKAELEDKVKELTDTIARLKACCPETQPKSVGRVLHG